MNSLVPVFERTTLVGHLTGSCIPQKTGPWTVHPSQSSFLFQRKPGVVIGKGVEAVIFDHTLVKDHAPCLVLMNRREYLGGWIPVDEHGTWHRNGLLFFLGVQHLGLDSAFHAFKVEHLTPPYVEGESVHCSTHLSPLGLVPIVFRTTGDEFTMWSRILPPETNSSVTSPRKLPRGISGCPSHHLYTTESVSEYRAFKFTVSKWWYNLNRSQHVVKAAIEMFTVCPRSASLLILSKATSTHL